MAAPTFDPSQPFEPIEAAPKAAPPRFDPNQPFEAVPHNKPQASWSDAITDVPAEIGRTAGANWQAMREAWPKELGGEREPQKEGFVEGLSKTGRGMAAVPGLALSPITGTLRSLIGHPMAKAEHALGEVINPAAAAKDDPEEMYQKAAGAVDTALMGLGPGKRGVAAPAPVPPKPSGPLGVTLSAGQETSELPKIRAEQAAYRGLAGAPAQRRAQEFFDVQQPQQVAAAKELVARSLDPLGQAVAESPAAGAEIAQQRLAKAAAEAKAGVKARYDYAASLPAQVHADALQGLGKGIKSDLYGATEPVIVDGKTTPQALGMLADIDRNISRLRIPNAADPMGPPNQQAITGVSLSGIDQMRKRLVIFARDARNSGNAADARAAGRVIDAFDQRIDSAIEQGRFAGDPRAIEAWKDARAANRDYRSTFSAGKNDPVGRTVERILGKGGAAPAIPNDVADYLYGASGVNPSSLNVGVATRVKTILGERSPEWSAVKQGLFSRLVEPAEGMTEFGHGRVAQRLNRFLNGDGRELANVVFSPQDQALLRQYADLRRQLEIPKTGANWSETSTFMPFALRTLEHFIGGAVGSTIGGFLGHPLFGWVTGSAAATKAGQVMTNMTSKAVLKQMPLISEQMKTYQRALARVQRQNSGQARTALAVASNNLGQSLQRLNGERSSEGHASGGRISGFADGGSPDSSEGIPAVNGAPDWSFYEINREPFTQMRDERDLLNRVVANATGMPAATRTAKDMKEDRAHWQALVDAYGGNRPDKFLAGYYTAGSEKPADSWFYRNFYHPPSTHPWWKRGGGIPGFADGGSSPGDNPQEDWQQRWLRAFNEQGEHPRLPWQENPDPDIRARTRAVLGGLGIGGGMGAFVGAPAGPVGSLIGTAIGAPAGAFLGYNAPELAPKPLNKAKHKHGGRAFAEGGRHRSQKAHQLQWLTNFQPSNRDIDFGPRSRQPMEAPADRAMDLHFAKQHLAEKMRHHGQGHHRFDQDFAPMHMALLPHWYGYADGGAVYPRLDSPEAISRSIPARATPYPFIGRGAATALPAALSEQP